MNDQLRNAPIGVLETTADGEIEGANETAADVLDTDRKSLIGQSLQAAFPRSAAKTLHEAFAGKPPEELSFEEYYPTLDRWFDVDLARSGDRIFVYLRDTSQRRENEQTIERLRRRLDRLQTIDSLVGTVLQKVISASAREEVAQAICERLGTAELYEFAWVGERSFSDDTLEVLASAGDAPELLGHIRERFDSDGAIPEATAVTTEETQVVQPIAEAESIPRSVRLAAFGRGLQSCIAVPLTYGETVYGVLGVYSSRKRGFSDQERRSLETLGAIAGFAVNAIRQEDLLFADSVTELTLAVRDESTPFVDASRRGETELTLEGAVPREDDSVVCYVRADDVPAATVEALADHESVSNVRRIQEDDESRVLEVRVRDDAPVTVLAGWGATIRTAEYTGDAARIIAELPSDSELRRLVEAVDRQFAGAELVAKETKPREPEPSPSFQTELEDALTDKQLTVLETAYLADYFSSPRGSTSEELGEALDIAGPTVLYHLRRAQQKLLGAFFDDRTASTTATDRGSDPS